MFDREESRPSEDVGDAVVIGGVFGLVLGIVLHVEWVGILTGMAFGAMVDSVREYRRVKAFARAQHPSGR